MLVQAFLLMIACFGIRDRENKIHSLSILKRWKQQSDISAFDLL